MFIEEVDIKRPCEQLWSGMVGDERVRWCQKCDKSVYNLSDMSEQEVRKLLSSDSGRICVALTKTQGSKLITNNAPRWFRPVQSIVRKTVLAVLIGLNSSITAAGGQGLVGTPVDPRYGCHPYGPFARFDEIAYDDARMYCHPFMSFAAFLVMVVPFRKRSLQNPRLLVLEQFARFAIPVGVLVLGMSFLNSLGGLGGCPVGGIDTGPGRKSEA